MFTIRCKHMQALEKSGIVDLEETKTISYSCEFYEAIKTREDVKIVAKKHTIESAYIIHPKYASYQDSYDAIATGRLTKNIECVDVFIENASGKTIDAFKGSHDFYRAMDMAVKVERKIKELGDKK